jgi:hypothetical protein
MAAGKRREQRTRVYEQSGMIWTLMNAPLTEAQVAEFIRCGAFPSPADKRLPYMPEVDAKVLEIERNGGKLIVS